MAAANASSFNGESLAFYIGLKRIDTIMQRLVTHGLPVNTPIALIDQASTAQHEVCIGKVKNIVRQVT